MNIISRLIAVSLIGGMGLVSCNGAGNVFEEPAELEKCRLTPLPCGVVRPEGWLKYEMDVMTEGLVGRLYEVSEYLTPSNGWLTGGNDGWEEAAYWLRSFVKLAILTGNERCLEVSGDWIDKIIATQDEDGWYGPQYLKSSPIKHGGKVCGTVNDIWAHMIMNEALMSWYEYSGDERIPDLLHGFFAYCNSLEGDELINSLTLPGFPFGEMTVGDGRQPVWCWNVQRDRSGDMIPVLFRMYELTSDKLYLELSDRMFAALYSPGAMFLDRHTVSFAQRISYWTVYWRRSHNPSDYHSADYWYDLHMAEWGQMPRGMYAADENIRLGCTDPRYGCESCSWAELTRSFQLLSDVTGDTRWADRNEDVVFNHASAAYTPDWKELHYITAANQVSCDASTDHNYCNPGPMVAYSSKRYRCCRHNAGLTYPLFTENLVKKAEDGALVFWMYAPCSGSVDGVSWKLTTDYPFRETAELELELEKRTELRFRVPSWATSFEVKAGLRTCTAEPGALAAITLPGGSHRLTLEMGAECSYCFWPRNGGVSVDRGPLTYSLAIGEKYSQVDDPESGGVMTEVTPETPWNYGLDVSVDPQYRELEMRDGVLHSKNAPCEVIVKGRRINEWTLQDGESAELQRSVALTDEPLEELRFVPLCCQRLRLSVLPQATDDPQQGTRWDVPAPFTTRASRPGPLENY